MSPSTSTSIRASRRPGAARGARPRLAPATLQATLQATLAAVLLALGCAVPDAESESTDHAGDRPRAAAGEAKTVEQAKKADAARGEDDRGLLERFFGPEERKVVVPEGTVLQVSLAETLSSHASAPGERFQAIVLVDVAIDGVVAVPAGARLEGVVTEAVPARKIGGRARLSLVFDRLEANGAEAPIRASIARVGKSERAKDAAIIGGSTIAGAVLGEEVDEGEGGVIGAIVGGLAGAAAAKKTHGKPIVLEAGTEIAVRLESPVELTVEATI